MADAKSSLLVGYASGDLASGVTQNLTLPTSGSNGTSVAWSSSPPGIVSGTGVVVRPASQTTVTLTATITKGSASDTKTFSLTVFAAPVASNLLANPSADDGVNGWYFGGYSGTATMSGSGRTVFYLDTPPDPGFAYGNQTITLPSGSGGKFLLMVSYGWVEFAVPGSITRHPYLHGTEATVSSGYIYLQGMLHSAGSLQWQTISGIHQLEPDATDLTFALGQASGGGDPLDGTRAAFDDIGAYVFDTLQDATDYLDTYLASHPEVSDTK